MTLLKLCALARADEKRNTKAINASNVLATKSMTCNNDVKHEKINLCLLVRVPNAESANRTLHPTSNCPPPITTHPTGHC